MSNQVSLLREEKGRAFSFLFSLFLLSPVRRPSTQPLTPPYLPLNSGFLAPPIDRRRPFKIRRSLLLLRQRSLLRILLLLSSSWRYYYSLSLLFFFNLSLFLIVWDCLWIGLGTVAWFRRMGHCAVRAGAGRFSRLIYCRYCCWWNSYIWGISLSLTLGKLVII